MEMYSKSLGKVTIIDILNNRPVVKCEDGSIKTIISMSFLQKEPFVVVVKENAIDNIKELLCDFDYHIQFSNKSISTYFYVKTQECTVKIRVSDHKNPKIYSNAVEIFIEEDKNTIIEKFKKNTFLKGFYNEN